MWKSKTDAVPCTNRGICAALPCDDSAFRPIGVRALWRNKLELLNDCKLFLRHDFAPCLAPGRQMRATKLVLALKCSDICSAPCLVKSRCRIRCRAHVGSWRQNFNLRSLRELQDLCKHAAVRKPRRDCYDSQSNQHNFRFASRRSCCRGWPGQELHNLQRRSVSTHPSLQLVRSCRRGAFQKFIDFLQDHSARHSCAITCVRR